MEVEILEPDIDLDVSLDELFTYSLILWNDDHNSFDDVIRALTTVVGHTMEQAMQCAYIAHTKGKCQVKEGDYDEMVRLKRGLNDYGLEATVE